MDKAQQGQGQGGRRVTLRRLLPLLVLVAAVAGFFASGLGRYLSFAALAATFTYLKRRSALEAFAHEMTQTPVRTLPGVVHLGLFGGLMFLGHRLYETSATQSGMWVAAFLALAAASCLAGFGGPLEDIPVATLRQLLIPTDTIAGATRAAQIVSNLGTLVAMLVAPAACVTFGPVAVMWACGLIYACVVGYGLAIGLARQ